MGDYLREIRREPVRIDKVDVESDGFLVLSIRTTSGSRNDVQLLYAGYTALADAVLSQIKLSWDNSTVMLEMRSIAPTIKADLLTST